jgi:hypothetical protein
MWTPICALVVLSALADVWRAWLRRRGTLRRVRLSRVAGVLLVVASLVQLGPATSPGRAGLIEDREALQRADQPVRR